MHDPKSECICPENIDSVCGDDGVEYTNGCQATCVGASFTQGSCSIETNAQIIDLGNPALDGCGWVIRFNSNGSLQDHKVDVLDSDFQAHELDVKIIYKPTLANVTACFAPVEYLLIEIISIEEL